MPARIVATLISGALAACGRVGFDVSSSPDDASSTVDGVATNTISGTGCPAVAGTAFATVVAAYSVGNVEFANETTILIFDRAITCAYLSNGTSWDDSSSATIANGTQFLRLTLDGGDPHAYPLADSDPPAANAGFGGYYQTVAPGIQDQECDATSGTATVTSGGRGGAIGGDFTVMVLGGGTLTGTFAAAWCPTGWYP